MPKAETPLSEALPRVTAGWLAGMKEWEFTVVQKHERVERAATHSAWGSLKSRGDHHFN